ncbi:MAG: MBL fold metallo-hydrolase [Candidatus Aminicenantes bacterium]|nr:MBL fold metallo-hydrolase [Candidatus Aminicenantes bacterium]
MRFSAQRSVFGVAYLLLLAARMAGTQDLAQVQIKTIPIAGNVSMLVGSGGNIAVSVGEDGALLVDDGYPKLVEKIKAAVAALKPVPIRFVLNTNWHYDHADGNELLGRAGAVVIAHENSRQHMLGQQTFLEMDPDFKIAPYPKEALPVITVADAVTLHFNGDEIRMVHVPNAHSDGDLLFRFVKANAIHTGDLFFSNGFPFINVSCGGTIDGLVKGVDIILGMCDERTRVIPGHGPVSDREGVQAFKDLIVAGRERIAALIKNGKTLEETLAAKPVEGLYRGGKSWMASDTFVKVVYLDLTGKFHKPQTGSR